jgi:hypothetical protein
MAKKMLGKIVAGAALGSASLLLFSPLSAYASGNAEYVGTVANQPQINLLDPCRDSKDWNGKDWDRKDHDRKDEDRKDWDGKDWDGKDWDGKEHDRKDHDGKDEDRKDWDGKDWDRKDKDRKDHCAPRGHVDGGDGGMTTTSIDRGLATGGAGVIGAAALGGIMLMRRRRANDLV